MYMYNFLLRMTDTMTSQNIDISSWDTLYMHSKIVLSYSSIHSVVCVATGPYSLPKRVLHRLRSSASFFNYIILYYIILYYIILYYIILYYIILYYIIFIGWRKRHLTLIAACSLNLTDKIYLLTT